jgi:Na+/melibiose symporter-like transporter
MGLIDLCGAFMDRQFQKTPDGYVYRFNAKGPPVQVSAPDHARYVRRGGWSFLFHVGGLMLSIVAAAMVTAHWFPDGGEAGGMVLMGLLLIVIGLALYRSLAWSMRAPERELGPARAARSPAPASQATRPASRAPRARKASGLIFLGYFLAEMIGGIAGALLLYRLLEPLNGDAAIAGALIGFIAAAWAIDRLCVRQTGESVLESLPFIP